MKAKVKDPLCVCGHSKSAHRRAHRPGCYEMMPDGSATVYCKCIEYRPVATERLHAAAPQLLAACKALVRAADHSADCGNFYMPMSVTLTCVNKARAAIKAATKKENPSDK